MADRAELQRLLREAGAAAAELAPSWGVAPSPPPAELLDATLEAILNAPCIAHAVANCAPVDAAIFPQLCKELLALEALLGPSGGGAAAQYAETVCRRLDELPAKTLPPSSQLRILVPATGGCAQEIEVLRLVLVILARCTGPQALTSRELLDLANGDLLTACAVAVAAMHRPGAPPVPKLQVRLWQLLYELSTPQRGAELALGLEIGGSTNLNDMPIQDLLSFHVAHAHRVALCMAQSSSLEAMCVCAEQAEQRGPVVTGFLRTCHNLAGSEHLWQAGRIVGRQLCVLWPRFGFRLLAPHLRKLLAAAEGNTKASAQASRDFRRDLRTLGWLLHHCFELRQHAKPLCAELAMRAAKSAGHRVETLAVVVGTAANAGALEDRGVLYATLDGVEEGRKTAVREQFPAESNRMWIVGEAWQLVEDLGYWPKDAASQPTADAFTAYAARHAEMQAAASAAADLAAIARLATVAPGFNFLDPDTEAYGAYGFAGDDDEEWGDWGDEDEDDDQEDACYSDEGDGYEGPLGLLNVPAPPPPPPFPGATFGVRSATEQLCVAPEGYRCGLAGHICAEPVRTPGNLLFERRLILAWLGWNKVCPVTGEALSPDQLLEDSELIGSLDAWLTSVSSAY